MPAPTAHTVHQTWGNGRWFPAGGAALRSMIQGYMDAAPMPEIPGRIVSAIAPHAGYVYSGPVAGYTFRALNANAKTHPVDTVVVLGFSHQSAFQGLALMDGDAIRTPLGETALDRDAALFLTKQSPRLTLRYAPHRGEHSAENEIPFVQEALPKAKLVVGLFGNHDPSTIDDLVAALKALAKDKHILVVASTDFLHDADYNTVTRTDRITLDKIAAMDDAWLVSNWSYGHQLCCGLAPVLTAIRFADVQGSTAGTVLHYRNSGDDHPESRGQWVVGYGAVVFAAP